ncbi:hypothetical protein P0Y35_01785 [Kiritimatiellaeota bacterium B1221]|nr:hypothetical protein [Kiritimatiellaeota bacterium B1221]
MEYKKVKNSKKPGRPPSGCVWVKDAEGNLTTNEAGEVAYRPATAEDLKNKKKPAGKKRGRKPGSKKETAIKSQVDTSALLLKKTYKELSAKELEKVKEIVSSMVSAAKEQEKKALQISIEKLQDKLSKLD